MRTTSTVGTSRTVTEATTSPRCSFSLTLLTATSPGCDIDTPRSDTFLHSPRENRGWHALCRYDWPATTRATLNSGEQHAQALASPDLRPRGRVVHRRRGG